MLSSSDVSSTLWTASAMPSNVAMSTGTQPNSSAISTSSVYSQDSWRSPPPPVNTDGTRYAMAFSASVEWEEQNSDGDSITATTPIQSSHPIDPAGTTTTSPSSSDLSTPEDSEDSLAREYNKWKEAKERESNKKKLKKVHSTAPKRASRSSKAFSKVLARLSIQPLAKRAAKRQTMPALSPIFQLPEVQMSPIHIHIPASPSRSPTSEEIATRLSPDTPPVRSSISLVRKTTVADVKPHPPPPYRRIHKRYPSSPAILGWNPKMLPTAPVPELPTHIIELTALRSRSHIAKRNSTPVPPVPLPVHALEQDHNPIDRLRQLRSEVASAPSKTALSQKRATLHNPCLSTSAVSRVDIRPPLPDGPLPTRLRSRSFSQRNSDHTLRGPRE
ncbi:hypothetical protein K443DRAFT_600843 [Laccaria amethystina LaAM-08-1]|uniref:Uncharacterized protein n=1 Tax=Laccaria amethystina LaAM-08-1 TaxID=1095629 RepID=A0A0C9X6F5_9AGAR|nr:hypothetical protein K443DRAFT_600843 [Laccaria amethystina LaAM-08-1]